MEPVSRKQKMTGLLVLMVLAILLILAPQSVRADAVSLGLQAGYAPDILQQRDLFEALSLTNQRVERRVLDSRNLYGDRVSIKDFQYSGTELNSIPFGFHLNYIYNKLFFRLAYIQHNIFPEEKSYVLNTRGGVDSTIQGGRNLYADIDRNNDGDMTNDYPYAAGLMKTYGQDYYFRSITSAQLYEIPFTFGIVLIGKKFYKFYVGAGLVFFKSHTTRVIDVRKLEADGSFSEITGANTGRDIDKFGGTAVGFHFMSGAEFSITRRFGLFSEFVFDFGAIVPLEDQVQTGGNTVNSLFQANTPEDPGGSEAAGSPTRPARPRMSGLNFVGIRLSLGVNYYLAFSQDSRRRL